VRLRPVAIAALLAPAAVGCGTAAQRQATVHGNGGQLLAVVKVGAPRGGTAKHARITVRPATGGPTTVFTVSFVAPEATGTTRAGRRFDSLEAVLAHSTSSCVGSAEVQLPTTRAGAQVSTTLDPAKLGAGRWCPGSFTGKITQNVAPVCSPGTACPQYIAIRGVVGTFRFRVLK
jgi:hypothetical protein